MDDDVIVSFWFDLHACSCSLWCRCMFMLWVTYDDVDVATVFVMSHESGALQRSGSVFDFVYHSNCFTWRSWLFFVKQLIHRWT